MMQQQQQQYLLSQQRPTMGWVYFIYYICIFKINFFSSKIVYHLL